MVGASVEVVVDVVVVLAVGRVLTIGASPPGEEYDDARDAPPPWATSRDGGVSTYHGWGSPGPRDKKTAKKSLVLE